MVEANSIGMKLVLIPSGEFMMGTRAEEIELLIQEGHIKEEDRENPLESFRNEAPQRRVRITNAFYLGTHAVTVGEFHWFVRAANFGDDEGKDSSNPPRNTASLTSKVRKNHGRNQPRRAIAMSVR